MIRKNHEIHKIHKFKKIMTLFVFIRKNVISHIKYVTYNQLKTKECGEKFNFFYFFFLSFKWFNAPAPICCLQTNSNSKAYVCEYQKLRHTVLTIQPMVAKKNGFSYSYRFFVFQPQNICKSPKSKFSFSKSLSC